MSTVKALIHCAEPSTPCMHGYARGIIFKSAPTDFEDALHLLEGSFIGIRDEQVTFVNPSVRDYLQQYLTDQILLTDMALSAPTARWALAVWEHYESIGGVIDIKPAAFAKHFSEIAKRFDTLPTLATENGELRSDLALSDRVELLAEWARLTGLRGDEQRLN